ncbi:carboxypeptidase regulatory-like domain-containing protein [Candidatus Dojkabacteria bacterium]|nr:carboxypeptidase regulatory-like domain-containing protein [Candidatus Dojkabacteria bacterium]
MKSKKIIKIVILVGVPVLVVAISIWIYFNFFVCNKDVCEFDKESLPKSEISVNWENLPNFAWKLPMKIDPLINVTGDTLNLIPETVHLTLITINLGHYEVVEEYYFKDSEFSDFTYKFKLYNDLPDSNSLIWIFTICDKSGRTYSSVVANTTAYDFMGLFFILPAYILVGIILLLGLKGALVKENVVSVVYNSNTKVPVSRAIVRLYKDGRLFQTAVSDVRGIYKLNPMPGKYKIDVKCAGYKFPSFLSPRRVDGKYENLYYGQEFTIDEGQIYIKFNIPLDSTSKEAGLIRKVALGTFSTFLGLNTGLMLVMFLAMTTFFRFSSIEAYVIDILLLGIWGYKLWLGILSKLSYGTVKDQDGKTVPNLQLGLYEREFDNLFSIVTTDENGRYQFAVPGGKYYIQSNSPKISVLGDNGSDHIYVDLKPGKNHLFAPNLKVYRDFSEDKP